MTSADDDRSAASSAAPHSAAAPLSAQDDQLWAGLAHLGGIVGFLPSLIIFLSLRRSGAKTRVESKEALNWQITLSIGWAAINVVVFVISTIVTATLTDFRSSPLGTVSILFELIILALWIVNVVLSITGCVRVNAGGSYRYPFALRFIK